MYYSAQMHYLGNARVEEGGGASTPLRHREGGPINARLEDARVDVGVPGTHTHAHAHTHARTLGRPTTSAKPDRILIEHYDAPRHSSAHHRTGTLFASFRVCTLIVGRTDRRPGYYKAHYNSSNTWSISYGYSSRLITL